MYDYAHVSGVGPATSQVSDRSCAIIFPRVADVVIIISQSVLLRIYYRSDDYLLGNFHMHNSSRRGALLDDSDDD
jgi:hypothetical protein